MIDGLVSVLKGAAADVGSVNPVRATALIAQMALVMEIVVNFFCNAGCLNTKCNQTTGECFSCINGYWGLFCNVSCSSGCSSSGCDHESGKCFECANQTLHGELCGTPCSDNCVNNQCERNGECSFGCETDHFSPMCKTKCSDVCKATIIGSRCDDLVQCLEGCVHGYNNEDCEMGQ